MRKHLVLFLLITSLLVSPTIMAKDEDYDFRQVNWGMSVDEVKENEEGELIDGRAEGLMYKVNLNNKEYILMYYFKNNKLYETQYVLNESLDTGRSYVHEFNDIKSILTEKYGESSGMGEIWIDDTYEDEIGLALMYKDLMYHGKWESDKVIITTLLSSTDGDIFFVIGYESKEYQHLKEEKEEEDKEETKSNL